MGLEYFCFGALGGKNLREFWVTGAQSFSLLLVGFGFAASLFILLLIFHVAVYHGRDGKKTGYPGVGGRHALRLTLMAFTLYTGGQSEERRDHSRLCAL